MVSWRMIKGGKMAAKKMCGKNQKIVLHDMNECFTKQRNESVLEISFIQNKISIGCK